MARAPVVSTQGPVEGAYQRGVAGTAKGGQMAANPSDQIVVKSVHLIQEVLDVKGGWQTKADGHCDPVVPAIAGGGDVLEGRQQLLKERGAPCVVPLGGGDEVVPPGDGPFGNAGFRAGCVGHRLLKPALQEQIPLVAQRNRVPAAGFADDAGARLVAIDYVMSASGGGRFFFDGADDYDIGAGPEIGAGSGDDEGGKGAFGINRAPSI